MYCLDGLLCSYVSSVSGYEKVEVVSRYHRDIIVFFFSNDRIDWYEYEKSYATSRSWNPLVVVKLDVVGYKSEIQIPPLFILFILKYGPSWEK